MTIPSEPGAPKPSMAYPAWAGWLSVAMFSVGCLSAALSGTVQEINRDKMGFILGAAVFIPLGALGLANAYTATVRADLLRRIEELEARLKGQP